MNLKGRGAQMLKVQFQEEVNSNKEFQLDDSKGSHSRSRSNTKSDRSQGSNTEENNIKGILSNNDSQIYNLHAPGFQ